MKTKIKLLKHTQYGRERLYPGCSLSRAICAISGGKTMNEEQADILTAIGNCEIEVEVVKNRPKQKGE